MSFPCKNREADLRYAQASSLKAIVYPHGGRKEFEYELNEGVLPNGTVIHGGGLRISKITESETSTSEQDARIAVKVMAMKILTTMKVSVVCCPRR